MTFSPMLIVVCAAVAIISFMLGWNSKGSGARRREQDLKREVLEAKRSIPQLESSVRNRELQIARLEGEVKELTERSGELHRNLEIKETELRSANRVARNLTSELEVVKGSRTSSGNVIVDGFEDEEPELRGDSKLAMRLKKSEALYEKLKQGLLQRDEQIEKLQSQLSTGAGLQGPGSAELEARVAELDAHTGELREKIEIYERTIEKLRAEITEVRQEKDMLADMAKRRSETNQALKEASAEAEAQLPKLKQDIEAREKTITDREASIKRLLGELDQIKAENAGQEQQIAELSRQVSAHQEVVAERDMNIQRLESSVNQREERISLLDAQLNTTRGELQQTLATVQSREKTIVEQQAKVDAAIAAVEEQRQIVAAKVQEHAQTLAAAVQQHDLAAAALKSTIEDRDLKIRALGGDIDALQADLLKSKAALKSLQSQATEAQAAAEQRQVRLTAELAEAQSQADTMRREIQDLNANLEQREKWLAKLKESLAERESQNRSLETMSQNLQSQHEDLIARLEEQQQARKDAEAAVRERDRQISASTAKSKLAVAELAEQNQSINVYKSVVADREQKLARLSDEVTNLSMRLDVEKQTAAEATANCELIAARLRELESAVTLHRDDDKPANGTSHPAESDDESAARPMRIVRTRRRRRRPVHATASDRSPRADDIRRPLRQVRIRPPRVQPQAARRYQAPLASRGLLKRP